MVKRKRKLKRIESYHKTSVIISLCILTIILISIFVTFLLSNKKITLNSKAADVSLDSTARYPIIEPTSNPISPEQKEVKDLTKKYTFLHRYSDPPYNQYVVGTPVYSPIRPIYQPDNTTIFTHFDLPIYKFINNQQILFSKGNISIMKTNNRLEIVGFDLYIDENYQIMQTAYDYQRHSLDDDTMKFNARKFFNIPSWNGVWTGDYIAQRELKYIVVVDSMIYRLLLTSAGQASLTVEYPH